MEEKALRMMKLMGYKEGLGLGKAEQGLTEAIDVKSNLGTRGLGLNIENLNYSNDSWDYSQDKVEINESVEWLMNKNVNLIDKSVINNWLKEGVPNNDVAINNGCFCDEEIQKNVFKGKDIFNELDNKELNRARTRANPFETIRSVFFMNRAALKMANIDAACNFMFTSIEEAENEPVYFADVCAGPGGFSEYILWRNQWRYKGFGLTLKNEHDFTISKSTCASAATFQALYGDDQTGDVCNPNNIVNFVEKIKHETNFGVNFMMSDGGFCVDGQENLQEILSKRIYLSQCLIALRILRPNGHFVTKMFDIFTTFSVGLLYLMYLCFEQVVIIKPNSSRPANSERYFVCKNFQENAYTNIIREYLWKIVLRLWEIRCLPDKDILEIVPCEILQQDLNFYQYIVNTNNSIGKKQIMALKKLAHFCRNPNLVDLRQEILRNQCLQYWNIPNESKKKFDVYKPEDLLKDQQINSGELFAVKHLFISNFSQVKSLISHPNNWHYIYTTCTEKNQRINFFVGVGNSKVFQFKFNKWTAVRNLELPKGTLLYGEFVKEQIYLNHSHHNFSTRYSFHVIDAISLGKMDIRDYQFNTRLKLINIFCKSVNKESQQNYSVRVRTKPIFQLQKNNCMNNDEEVLEKNNLGEHILNLPKIGFKSTIEQYVVNSILIINTTENYLMNNKFQIKIPMKILNEFKLFVNNCN